MKWEFERNERGTDQTIKDWINQIKTYYIVDQFLPKALVGSCL